MVPVTIYHFGLTSQLNRIAIPPRWQKQPRSGRPTFRGCNYGQSGLYPPVYKLYFASHHRYFKQLDPDRNG